MFNPLLENMSMILRVLTQSAGNFRDLPFLPLYLVSYPFSAEIWELLVPSVNAVSYLFCSKSHGAGAVHPVS